MTEYGQRVLYLSGPIEPPWTRTDKVLVRGVATHLERYRPRVLTHEGVLSQDPGVETEPAWGPRVAGHTSIGRRLGLFSKLIDLQGISLLHLLIRHGAATRVSALFYLTPPTTAMLAWAVFGTSALSVISWPSRRMSSSPF